MNDEALTLIKATNLACARGYSLLFSGLGLEVRSGAFCVLRGPNGSGKTTLLRLLAGLSEPEVGEVVLGTEDEPIRPFFLGHESGLRAGETPLQHLSDWADLHETKRSSVRDALHWVGLAKRQDVPAHALSAGQKRRLGLARAIVAPTLIWLLDEPAAALDTDGQALLVSMMKNHLTDGGAIIAALHDPSEIEPDQTLNVAEFKP